MNRGHRESMVFGLPQGRVRRDTFSCPALAIQPTRRWGSQGR